MFRRLLFVIALACLPSLAFAVEVPYTGNLFMSGTPFNGTPTISLAVYNVASGGSPIHTQVASLDVSNGVFHTVLVVPDGTWFGGDRWIGVSVNGGAELSPRVKYYAPPRPTPQIFSSTPASHVITSNQWTKLDSVVVTAPVSGFVSVSHLGIAQWGGSITIPAVEFDLNVNTPTGRTTVVLDNGGNHLFSLAMTSFFPVSAGVTKIYLWSRIVITGNLYNVETTRFQALFIPN